MNAMLQYANLQYWLLSIRPYEFDLCFSDPAGLNLQIGKMYGIKIKHDCGQENGK